MQFFALILLLLVFGADVKAAERSRHVEATLIAETSAAAPGMTLMVGLRQIIEPGWHTYWVNPGDAGEPTHIDWRLPDGFAAGPIQWPAPERIPAGPLMSFGYRERVVLLSAITVPRGLQPGGTVTLTAHASWLVCAEICVPEDADLALTLPVADGTPEPDPLWASDFTLGREALPKPFTGKARVAYDGASIRLLLTGGALPARITGAAFFPDGRGIIRSAADQVLASEPGSLQLTLAAGPNAKPGNPLAGILTLSDGAEPQAFTLTAEPAAAPPAVSASGLDVPMALLFAVLGGLILNLMPCVFPVLSMKALMIAQHAEAHRSRTLRQGLAYGAGVVLSFVGVAGLLLLLRGAGQEVGWGFQFQSPLIVALLALLFLAIALNLAGFFEVSLLQSLGAGRRADGLTGAFLTGILAVLAASPCTAPFMGTAIGFGLTASPAVALAIFAGLGLGMAAPFVLISASPSLLKLLPKPGPWMVRLKLWLTIPMALASFWLIWVLGQQTGPAGLALIVLAGGGLALTLWALGGHQRGRTGLSVFGAAGLALLAAGLVLIASASLQPQETIETGRLPGEPYTPERLAALRQEGRPVFVNLTAAWCITCKFNEALALSSRDVASSFRLRNIAYLRGDWTLRDPQVTRLLAAYGRNGVPLYLYFAPGAARATVLPQLLTEQAVLRAIAPGVLRPSSSGPALPLP